MKFERKAFTLFLMRWTYLIPLLLVTNLLYGQNRPLDKHFEMIGDNQLQQLRTASIVGRYVSQTREPASFVAYIKYPDKIRINWTQGRVRWTDIYKEGKAITIQDGIVTELSGPESFDLLWMLRATSPLRHVDGTIVDATNEKWNSKEYYKFGISSDESSLEFLLDKTSYEIVLERIINISAKGKKGDVQEIKYLKYMDLGGVKVPALFILDTEEGSADLIFDEVLLGYPVNDSVFK